LFGPFRRFVTTSAGCTTPTRPSLPSRWTVPPASICPTPGLHLASTTTNESSQLVGGFLSLHLPYTRPPSGLHHHQRVLATRWWLPQPPSALHPASIWPPPPPTSLDDSLVASPASICPIPPPTSPRDSLDGSPGLHLPYTRPPSGLHHHQRVLATRWTVSPASFRLPTTTTESRRLVGRFPGLHLPFHHHQRCSLGFHQGYFIV